MEGPEISFVTWPDGKVDGRSLTVCGEQMARSQFVGQWLPADWFGEYAVSHSVTDTLWRGAKEKGFRCYTIKIDKDGKPSLAD